VAGHVFISYDREDHAYVERLVAGLRDRGADVWVDHDIDYGQQWVAVIEERIKSCAVMLVVMSPRSEASPWVKREIYAAEQAHKTILPVLLEGEMWFLLSNYQAEIVRDRNMPDDRFLAAVVAAASGPAAPRSVWQAPRAIDRSESLPRTMVVDAMGRGDFDNLTAAVMTVTAGTRLLLRPGTYTGDIAIDRPLELVGDGDRNDIVVEASTSEIVWTAKAGRIENLTIRSAAAQTAIRVVGGVLDIVACDISSSGEVGVHVEASRVAVKKSKIHDCLFWGVTFHKKSRGTLEDNDITNCDLGGGIAVRSGSVVEVRKNRVSANTTGILISGADRGVFEDNDITNSRSIGIMLCDGGTDPVVRNNRVSGNGVGIYISDGSRGTFEKNVISQNGLGSSGTSYGVIVDSGEPIFRSNRLSYNGKPGILLKAEGGLYRDNIRGEIVRE
jgi:parallel beta-helix repeat protein